jgi:heme/copper-type cytochrome/quinol oxidase subunit 2
MNKPLVYIADALGIMVPGNDVMSAIVLLFVEVLSYGAFIFFFVIFLLCQVLDRFTMLSYGMSLESLAYQNASTRAMPKLWVAMLFMERGREVSYPVYFSKKQESVLDAAFLVIPTVLVTLMLVPALGFLYTSDFHFAQATASFMSIDIIGHQWYWAYEYNVGGIDCDFLFDSILDVDAVVLANLEVDARMLVPTDVIVSLAITSNDVIHSWAVPGLGIKVDAVPGKVATTLLYTFLDGVYYGQCSELCGVLHGFMPICVESVPLDIFHGWTMLQWAQDKHLDVFLGISDIEPARSANTFLAGMEAVFIHRLWRFF